jgi:hypothetical protein
MRHGRKATSPLREAILPTDNLDFQGSMETFSNADDFIEALQRFSLGQSPSAFII